MRYFWFAVILAASIIFPARAADRQDQGAAAQPSGTSSVDITVEPPSPGYCPVTAAPGCARLLKDYAKAFRELSEARNTYFNNLAAAAFPSEPPAGNGGGTNAKTQTDSAPPPKSDWALVNKQKSEVEAAIEPLEKLDAKLKGLSEKAGTLFKKAASSEALGVFKFLATFKEATDAREAARTAMEAWAKDPFGKQPGGSPTKKEFLDQQKAVYFDKLNKFYVAAADYERFASEFGNDDVAKLASDIESMAAIVKRDIGKQPNSAGSKDVAQTLKEKQDLWAYTKSLASYRHQQLNTLQEAYDKAEKAGREAMIAGAKLESDPAKTEAAKGIRIIAALYGQNEYIMRAYHLWRTATDDKIDRDLEEIREILRSGRSGKDAGWELHPAQAMCDGTSYIKIHCGEYIEGTVKYCRNKLWPGNSSVDECSGANGDFPDSKPLTTVRMVKKGNPPPDNCAVTVLPDPFCGGPVAWSPTAGKNALIIYQCGAKPRQFALGSNNQTLYMFCEGP